MDMKTHQNVPVPMAITNPINSAFLVEITNSFQLAARFAVNVMYHANHAQAPAQIAQNAMTLYSLWTQLACAQTYLPLCSQVLGRSFAPSTWMYP